MRRRRRGCSPSTRPELVVWPSDEEEDEGAPNAPVDGVLHALEVASRPNLRGSAALPAPKAQDSNVEKSVPQEQ